MLVIVDEKTVAVRLKRDENPALPETAFFEHKPVNNSPGWPQNEEQPNGTQSGKGNVSGGLRRSSGGKSRAADHVPSGVQQAQHNFRKRNAFWRFAKSKDEPDSHGESVATDARRTQQIKDSFAVVPR
jgi:hypothetical protein